MPRSAELAPASPDVTNMRPVLAAEVVRSRTTPGGRVAFPYVRHDAPNVRQTIAAAFSTA